MSKFRGGDEEFRKRIYAGMHSSGYSGTYDDFNSALSDVKVGEDIYQDLVNDRIFTGSLDDFKANFYGVKKKEPITSKESLERSEQDYVNIAGVQASGSTIERANSGFQFVREGQEFTAGKKEQTVAQIKEMRQERPGASIVQVKDDKGRPTLKFLEDHKEQVKSKATRVPDAVVLDNQDAKQSVEQYYQNKPDYLAMVKERKEKGYENTYNAGKFVDQGISDMQRDVRNAIDIKAKEIGKPVLSQYLNLNEQLKKTPETAREYPQLVADYQKFNQAHPDLAEYEGLVNKFWALDSKSKEARKNPAYKDYYANLDKKEQAQATADMFANIGMVNNDPTRNNPFLPAATKELYDLGTGLVRAAAGMQRWVTGSKYSSLDGVIEKMDQVLDPNNYSKTATPSNRTQLVGQKYADVGDFKVLFDGDKVMGVVTKDGGYKVRDQGKVDEVMAAYERDKPKIKTQAINPYTATDVIIGGATQLGLGMVSAGVGAKLGKAGSMISNFGSKATTIATNSAGTYNKLYNSAIQELGASNQKAAERYAGLAAIGMSMIGTLVNPLEQQLLGQIQKQSIRSLAKELGEGVAEQTAVRNATRMLLTGIKTVAKEGAEGAPEALLDDAVKAGVNKTMLKGDTEFEIDLPQDIIDNVWEETLGGLVGGSMTVNTNLSQLQKEAFQNAMTSPNRPKILARISEKYGKAAAKHYETVFAKAELTGRSPVDIHKEELVKAKTGEEYIAPAQTVPAQEEPGVVQPAETPPTQDERSAIVKDIADQIDLKPGQKITTPMGQTATIVGFDVDEADEDGEGAANNYLIRMDESGEETVVSIADYNKRVYEQGIGQLQAQGMDRNEAEFAIEAARSVRGLNVGQAVSNVTESPEVEAPKDVEAVANVDTPVVGESPVVADQSGEQSVIKSTKVEPINNPALAQSKKIDGITYDRQPPIQGVTGSSGKIEFSASSPMQDFTYKVIEADQLQPSHSNSGGRNPLHFIPEAQPKERNDKAGTAASDAIADNIDFGRVSAAPNAYTGAPIVNDRGEVIQGNNRAIGIKKHYQGGKGQYKEQLISQAQQLGIDPTKVQGMKNPVLVREVKVNDATAIELGNYDVKDLETGGQRRIDPVATSRRIPFAEKQKIASVLLTNPDKTLRENIKDNFAKAAKLLVPKFISPNQYDTIFSNKTNNITPKGVDDITELVLHFLFDGGDIKLRQVFDMLPSALQQGIINSMPQLFSVPQSESIVEQLQNAIILLYEVDTAKSATIDEFLGQIDMFDAAKANRFSPTDIALAKLLTGKKQKEVQTLFSKYAALTLGSTDMFGTTPGVSKAKALSELTGVLYSPTPQDITNGANQNIQRNASGENSGSRGSTRPDARISDETTSSGTTASYQGAVQFVDTKSTPGRLKPLAKVVEKALKAMSKYGNFKVYFYENQGDIRQSYNERANFALNDQQSVTGFFNPDDNSIHIYVNADGASTIALHEILHPFVRAIKKANPGLFTNLYENLKTIPEYSAVTMTGNSVKGFSENPYYDFIGTTEEEALVEFFAKVGSGELILRGKSKGKVVDWINSILRAIGFNEISVDADIRKWANAIATALQQGIELEGINQVSEERVTPQDIALAQKLLGQAKSTLRGSIEALGEKVVKALKKYGDVKVVIHETNAEISAEYNKLAKAKSNVTGFYDPKSKTIHVSLESGNPAHTLLHEALHVFIKGLDTNSFNKLFDELVSIPEYTQVLKTKGRSPAQHAALYPERKQKEEALVEYFAAIASGEIPVKKDSKVIQILNKLLKMLGFEAVVDNTNIRFIAEGLATALREGIEIERFGVNDTDSEVAQEIMVDFPYYDEVAKLVELGLQKGLAGDKITQGIQNAFTAQGITADPNVINAVYQARSATFRKSKPITNKVLSKVKEIHSKLFVAMGGGKIREFSERLDGTIQRYVEQVNALISVAEKQSKGVDQDLVDRFLRDENSADEKQVIVDELRKAGFDEKNLDQYQRRGTTRFQRSAMVQQFTEANPNTTPETDAALQQFIDSKMNTTDRDKVPDNLAETLTTMRMQIDNLSQYLIDEGYVVGERQDVIEKNLGQYMSDVYGIFKDKKFNPTKAAELKARKYFIEQIKNDPDKLAALAATGRDLDEEITKAAIKMVNDYKVKSKVSAGSFNAGTGAPVGKKSESIFKKKEGVPDELKDLLGKYNPLQEYAYTMYKLVSYVENSKFQRRLVNMGKGVFMWDKNDPARPEDANYELKGFASAKLQGDVNPLKGMMATKDVYDVLNGLDKDMFTLPPILKGFLKFQGWVNKMKTVYSYQTHFGNVIGNFFFMAFNGMLDLQTFSSINTSRKATGRDFLGKYGTTTDEVEKVLTVLKDEGVIGNEISIRAIRETVGRLEKSSGDSVGAQIGNKLIGADKAVTDLYQAEDSFFKILAYLTERKRYADALYGRKYENLTPVEQEEVSRQATEIAKSNYPNYGRMGKLSQSLAKNNVIFGNFLSFTFEAVRTYGNTIGLARRELLSPNPKVKAIGAKRTAGLIAGSLAADGLLMGLGKVTGGVFGLLFSDKDDTKLNRDLRIGVPKFLKGGDLLFTPIKTGVYRVVDLSAKNPLLVFRRHFNALLYTPSDEETAKAVATQFLESFFSKPIAMKYVDSINNNDNQKDGKIWLDSDSSSERAEKIFMFTVKTIAPSSINSARKLAEADNFWVTAGNQVAGMNSYEIDYERVWGNKIRDYESLSDAYRGIRKELKTAASDDTVTDREFKEALKEYNVKRKAQMDKLLEVKAAMMNIMPGKEGEKIIKGVIEESALGKDEKNYLNTGKWRDYSKSRNDLKYK